MGEKLNTAEYDKKGRCVRHPAIRLRKKKIFGGWKIIIGHCPECCLDEMRRVRDEIGAEDDNDDRAKRRSRKEKKKKRSDRDRDRGERDRRGSKHRHGRSEDSVSEAGSQPSRGYRASEGGGPRSHEGGGGGPSMGHIDEGQPPMRHSVDNQHGGHHHPQAPHIRHDGESTGTGSTAQNSSMDGSSDYRGVGYPHHGHHGGGRDAGGYYQQPPHNLPDNTNFPPPPPQPQRTMVLSMAFTDPQTGQRGTYTGQVNSINHKPDGKGTVYYANGNIAEGTWSAGMLLDDDDENSSHSGMSGSQHREYEPRGASRGRPQDVNRSRDNMGVGGGYGSAPPARGEEMGYNVVDNNVHHLHHHHHPPPNSRSRSTSRSRDPSGGMASPPPPPPRRHRDASRESLNRQHSSSGSRRSVNPPPPPPTTASSGFSGNLDKLDSLGGKKKSRRAPRGASASVQSYNSREGPNVPSGSASVQMEYGGSGRVFGDHMSSPLSSSSASMGGFDSGRISSGIVYDGGVGSESGGGYNNNDYRRRDSRGHSQPHAHHSHHGSSGRNPPGGYR